MIEMKTQSSLPVGWEFLKKINSKDTITNNFNKEKKGGKIGKKTNVASQGLSSLVRYLIFTSPSSPQPSKVPLLSRDSNPGFLRLSPSVCLLHYNKYSKTLTTLHYNSNITKGILIPGLV